MELTKEAGEKESVGMGGHVKWPHLLPSFLNLAPHREFQCEQFSKLKVPLCTDLTYASEYLIARWRKH